MKEVLEFLKVTTPQSWLEKAIENIDIVLIDHAHCEKKAASTAMQLLFRYVDRDNLLVKMSQLAREELLHFEQVLGFMRERGVDYTHLEASTYAQNLRQHVRTSEPDRLIDILIIGAIIEARSCERFAALSDYFTQENAYPELAKYYRFLLKSESRHFLDYLELATEYARYDIQSRVDEFLSIEAEFIQSPDPLFRFHSGVPVE